MRTDEKGRGPLKEACSELMYFFGSATRSARNGFYYLFGFMKPEEEGDAGETKTDFATEIKGWMEEAPEEGAKRERIDIRAFFKGIEFQDEAERAKAEVFTEDFRSEPAQARDEAMRQLKKISKPPALGILKRLLHSEGDPLRVAKILNALSSLNDDGKLEKSVFMDFLRDPNPIIRETVLRALARYGDSESYVAVSSFLDDRDAEVRRQALNCVIWFFRDYRVPAVLKSLNDDDNNVRKTAVFICGSLKLWQFIPALIMLLSDPDEEIQKGVAEVLTKITKKNFDFSVNGSKESKEAAIKKWRSWWRKNQADFKVK